MATSSSGSPNDGRAADLAIFTGIWTHSSCRLRKRDNRQDCRRAYEAGAARRPQPCPLDCALAFLDPLFARPAALEGDDPVGRARQVGDDETDARIKLAGMPSDFGVSRSPGAALSSFRLIGEIGMEPTHLVRWSSDCARLLKREDALPDPIFRDMFRYFE